ncbi:4-hydroxy-tetrahydrodipicolinate reductase [Paenimyroides viscosum]|uniref:4-hydroxy-tetrahydrodipicolinate reductase n=1 Tax=Paenimyroides viscosum TaxID=2488729 RepID=A0A3P1B4T6_9FLAO|nr:4-hydroxy-tetrahydrodipicolinate reductase [Paenimyroides viscosum]RRA95752.1 4-hydroxy-tetrahydrodipicolinate reductase [Paenimyroides viscosum]
MKIALLGYGRMGKEIEKIALERGHEIVLRKTEENDYSGLEYADVAIDFSIPTAATENISTCFNHNIPVVSGTTGWLEHYNDMTDLCQEKNGAFLYGSNFSVGVNLFFELNSYLAKLMANIKEYNVSMEEIHHTQKLDAPSGTAITLAQGIIAETDYKQWTMDNANDNEIYIDAKRIEDVPGTHSVFYKSAVDEIEIKHTAFSRQGFALGAVIAAEWILGKKGIFTMKDVLNLG